jgi:hypothetical protein
VRRRPQAGEVAVGQGVFRRCWSQPFVEGGEQQRGLASDGEAVVSGGHGPGRVRLSIPHCADVAVAMGARAPAGGSGSRSASPLSRRRSRPRPRRRCPLSRRHPGGPAASRSPVLTLSETTVAVIAPAMQAGHREGHPRKGTAVHRGPFTPTSTSKEGEQTRGWRRGGPGQGSAGDALEPVPAALTGPRVCVGQDLLGGAGTGSGGRSRHCGTEAVHPVQIVST